MYRKTVMVTDNLAGEEQEDREYEGDKEEEHTQNPVSFRNRPFNIRQG